MIVARTCVRGVNKRGRRVVVVVGKALERNTRARRKPFGIRDGRSLKILFVIFDVISSPVTPSRVVGIRALGFFAACGSPGENGERGAVTMLRFICASYVAVVFDKRNGRIKYSVDVLFILLFAP